MFKVEGTSILIECKIAGIQSPELAAFKRNVSKMASESLAQVEVQFLRKHPQAVSQELFLKPCAPFFENGLESVDWEKVEEKIQSTIQQFYNMDLSSFGHEIIKPLLNDVYFFATAKDQKTDKVLGFILFSTTPGLPNGDIKIINIIGDEVDELLFCSIFKVVPEVKRIFLFARPTNQQAINKYLSFGFNKCINQQQDPNHKVNLDNLVVLEYNFEQRPRLQKLAESLCIT